MISNELINQVIERGLSFINDSQKQNGSFPSYISNSKNNFKGALESHSLFTTSLCLLALNNIYDSKKIDLYKKALLFLLRQKSSEWTFNYWQRNSVNNKKMPYPDDLDDTFCALSVLQNEKKLNGNILAKVINILSLQEQKVGGPYKTWFVQKSADKNWQDIDIAVNANVAYFLSLLEVELPDLERYFFTQIENDKLTSPYYISEIPVIYFLSRFYRGKNKDKLTKRLLQLLNKGYFQNPLMTALALSSLINLGIKKDSEIIQETMDYILKNQKKGIWQAFGFYMGAPVKEGYQYEGSKLLTTAFCLEAINKVKSLKENFIEHEDHHFERILDNISSEIRSELNISPEFKDFLNDKHKIINKKKTEEIILMPYFFEKCLYNKPGKKLIIDLGKANFYGWLAYTIYDDCMDEKKHVDLIPVANKCLRKMALIFNGVLHNHTEFQSFVETTLDNIETANLFEQKRLRIDIKNNILMAKYVPSSTALKYSINKSFGHALSPLAILYAIRSNDESIEHFKKFFENYIAARQLNDDAHDWEEDLKSGLLNPISIQIIRHWKKIHSDKEAIDLKKDIEELESIFWSKISPYYFRKVESLTRQGIRSIERCESIKDPKFLLGMLKGVNSVAKKAKEERKLAIEFLKAYR